MKQLYWAFTRCMASIASAGESVRLLPTPLDLPTRIGPLQFDGKPHQYEPAALEQSKREIRAELHSTFAEPRLQE